MHLDINGEARADDEREHTAQLGGRETVGMVSSFGVDHRGELLLLNYSGGTVVRFAPDFDLVPRELLLTGISLLGRMSLSWDPPQIGAVAAADYVVERLRQGRLVERLIVERTDVVLDAADGDCFRVRARARSGTAGPAAGPVCASQP